MGNATQIIHIVKMVAKQIKYLPHSMTKSFESLNVKSGMPINVKKELLKGFLCLLN
jgi:hypothetical protein